MRESSLLVGRTLAEVARRIGPGVTTGELDRMAEQFIRDNGALPGFKGLYDCPSTLLISVNDEVVHGLPGDRVLRDGDVASVDCGVLMNGFYGDSAYTFCIGEVREEVRRLLRVTQECLQLGIAQAVANNRTGDIGHAIQSLAEKEGFSVVREYCGHGIGKVYHDEPQVLHYGYPGQGMKLKAGMIFTIEPMLNAGKRHVKTLPDHWTVVTRDGSLSAQWEHMVAVTDNGFEVLSPWPDTMADYPAIV